MTAPPLSLSLQPFSFHTLSFVAFFVTQWRDAVNRLVVAELTEKLHPAMVTGGTSLEKSVHAQTSKVGQLNALLEKVDENCRHREDKTRLLEQRVSAVRSRQRLLNSRLADVMGKLEVAVHLGSPLNQPERQLNERLLNLRSSLHRCGALVEDLRAEAMSGNKGQQQLQVVQPHDEAVLAEALANQRRTLETLAHSLQKDRRDIGIIVNATSSISG
jgi:hypothetical protein